MTRRLPVLALCTVLGCSRAVTGPTPAPSGASNPLDPARAPAQVCNAQGAPSGWRIDLLGDGFSPLSEQTLTDTPVLAMPTVTLVGSSTLELPAAQVSFVDRTHLALAVPTADTSPAATLAPGDYAVTVTNPTGLSATLTAGLTVVPPPTLSSASPEAPFSTSTSSTVDFTGTGFRLDAAPTIVLSGTGLPTQTLTAVSVVSDTRVTANVAANTAPGTYDVTLTNPEGCAALLPGGLVVSDATFGALSLQPRFGWQLQNQAITLFNVVSNPSTEQAFSGAPQLFLTAPLKGGAGPVDIPLRRVAFASPGAVTAVVPDCSGAAALPIEGNAAACAQGIQPGGPYPLKVLDPAGVQGLIPASQGFFVLANPPPRIDAIAPSSIDTGGSPDVKLSGIHFAADAIPRVVFLAGANVRACTLAVVGAATRSDTELHVVIPTALPASACDETTPQGAQVAAAGGFSLTAGLFVLRVQDVSDPAFADYSGVSVTNPSAKGARGPAVSSALSTGRADFALVEAQDDVGQHYLYALGGTDGTNLLSSVEVAPLTLFGDLGGDCAGAGCVFRTLDRTPLGVGMISGSPSSTPWPAPVWPRWPGSSTPATST